MPDSISNDGKPRLAWSPSGTLMGFEADFLACLQACEGGVNFASGKMASEQTRDIGAGHACGVGCAECSQNGVGGGIAEHVPEDVLCRRLAVFPERHGGFEMHLVDVLGHV